MQKTTFRVSQMDCAAEEQMIRLKLEGFEAIAAMQFDLPGRRLDVYHTGDLEPIVRAIRELKLGASLLETNAAEDFSPADAAVQRKVLWRVLGVNVFFFALEMLTGLIAGSMGLVADGLDMLADSLVYALALFAVGASAARKKGVARVSGYFQLILALLGVTETLRRVFGEGAAPDFALMIVISILALAGNAFSLYLLQKSRDREVHIRASVICTSNDVIVNAGVILAGVLVFLTDSKMPDLAVGAIVFLIVARGAYRILNLGR
jgi:Co/Zn/Cd efflux system component